MQQFAVTWRLTSSVLPTRGSMLRKQSVLQGWCHCACAGIREGAVSLGCPDTGSCRVGPWQGAPAPVHGNPCQCCRRGQAGRCSGEATGDCVSAPCQGGHLPACGPYVMSNACQGGARKACSTATGRGDHDTVLPSSQQLGFGCFLWSRTLCFVSLEATTSYHLMLAPGDCREQGHL